MLRPAIILLVLCSTAFSLHTQSVQACSRVEPAVVSRVVVPADGATEVPINARVVLVYRTHRMWNFHFAAPLVRREGAEPVGGETSQIVTEESTTLIFVPDAPLAPDTTYEVLDDVCLYCDSGGDAQSALAVVARFTTGPTRDDTPPSPPSAVTAHVGLEVCPDSSCCGPYSTRRIDIYWAAIPQGALARLDVDGAATAYMSHPFALGWLRCFGGYSPGAQFVSPGVISLRHVDVAGNLSDAVIVPIDLPSCSADQPDEEQVAEVSEPEPDVATEFVEPAPNNEDGCGSAGPRSAALIQVLGTLAVLILRPRPPVKSRRRATRGLSASQSVPQAKDISVSSR